MKKVLVLVSLILLILTANIFGQARRKKGFHSLPEVDDEVLVSFREKRLKSKNSPRRRSIKHKTKPFFDEADAFFGKRRKRSLTHDPEFENWASRKNKTRKIRRKHK